MGKVIIFNDYKIKKDEKDKKNSRQKYQEEDDSDEVEIDSDFLNSPEWKEFEREQQTYEAFYDHFGQHYYEIIKTGEIIPEKEWMEIWGIHSAEEFLKTWRGNSDKEYEIWKKERGYQ